MVIEKYSNEYEWAEDWMMVVGGNNAKAVMGVLLVVACKCKCNVVLVSRIKPTALIVYHR